MSVRLSKHYNSAFLSIVALVGNENQHNSENIDYFNAGVTTFRLKILHDHTNYAELHHIIKEDMPGLYVRNGEKFMHSLKNGFFAKEDEDNNHLEVSMMVKVYNND